MLQGMGQLQSARSAVQQVDGLLDQVPGVGAAGAVGGRPQGQGNVPGNAKGGGCPQLVVNQCGCAFRLAESEQVRACVVKQWFRFGYGRAEQSEDACSLSQATQAFEASEFRGKALLDALTQTDAFRYRPAVVTQAP